MSASKFLICLATSLQFVTSISVMLFATWILSTSKKGCWLRSSADSLAFFFPF